MIVKMTKYSFVLQSSNEDMLLEKLRECSLMDITRSTKPVDETSSDLLAGAETLRKRISDIEKDNFLRDSEYVSLLGELDNVQKLHKAVLPWGAFDAKAIAGLEQRNIKIRYYIVPSKKFDPSWAELQPLEVISSDEKSTWFVTAGPLEGYDFPIAESKAPTESADACAKRIAELEEAIEARKAVLSAEKELLPTLRGEYLDLLDKLEMYLAKAETEHAAEDRVCVVQGFAPTADDATVKAALDELDGVYYLAEAATKDDNPPIKIKNGWFASQFEALTGMYGLPVYDEWDPTPVLAPFFLLFFSLCMGDAGYGLLLIILAYLFRGMKNGGPMGLGNSWKLIRSLGVGTLVVGFFLGTFFGIDLYQAAWVPESLKGVMLKGTIGDFDIQMILALGIGVVHISLAMVIKSLMYTQRFGFKETISSWGWTLLLVGSLIAFAVCSAFSISAELTKWIIIAIAGVSVLGIFIFNKIGRNPLINIGAGLWDTYQMATGVLGDVLSYIRLYALGLAGGMLGGAFNNLGNMVLGDNPTWQFVPCILILVLGHALNLAMSCLGAYVHPLRLTFVEYFKNSGYEGKGVKFNPFVKKTIK